MNGPSLREIAAILLAFGAVAASGCKCRSSDDENDPEFQKGVEEAQAWLDERKRPPRKWIYPDEVYADPEIFKEHRLQFTWVPPHEQRIVGVERDAIWSVKLDGTDIRHAVPVELLYSYSPDASTISQAAVRSPDNRYIAYAAFVKDYLTERYVLVDLKERRVVTMMDNMGNHANFAWTPDSRTVLFHWHIGELWQFDVTKGGGKRIGDFKGPRIYPIGGKGEYLTITYRAKVEYRDRNANLLREIQLPTAPEAVSNDGTLFYLETFAGSRCISRIVSSAKPDEALHRDDVCRPSAVFGPDGHSLYYFHAGLKRLDFATKAITDILDLPGDRDGHELTLLQPRSAKR